MKDCATSLDYVGIFRRLGRAVIARSRSVSFKWPSDCQGWKDEAVKAMLEDLKLDRFDINGCAVGVQSKMGEPILKPWRIAVNSPLMRKALDGLRCQGDETARSASYPEHLCRGIHDGLDAHDSAAAGDCVGKGCEAILEGNIVSRTCLA